MTNISDIKKIDLPKIIDDRGNLSFIESSKHVPFIIKRVYWIYDVPGGEIRGSHAFKTQEEILIALSGSFDITFHDGNNEIKHTLNRSYFGLFVPPMIWRTIENFSTNALCLVLSSTIFDMNDYIFDFDLFKKEKTDK
jgi:dTDP-4-dehydrorhamnose 3,5-epimerase-like enzyme